MRKVAIPPRPPVLDGADSTGARERDAAIAFFEVAANRHRAFVFVAYKEAEVRDALNEAFHFKCAYCESDYGATQPVDVEHYRPKGRIRTSGAPLRPGYYWLASTWENLLPSCIDCNRARRRKHRGGKVAVSGKGNWFPLADEQSRARQPGEEIGEQALLLHPYYDDPDAHLEFIEEGMVRPALDGSGQPSPRGQATIDVLGLHRIRLVEPRRTHLRRVLIQLKRIRRAQERIVEYPQDPKMYNDLNLELSELSLLVAPSTPYSTMARQFIERARP